MVLAQEACSLWTLQRLGDAATTCGRRPPATPVGIVLADAKFDSEHNHRHVRERLAATSVIPGQPGQANVAGARLSSPDASRLSEPLVSAAGIGRERLLGGRTRAMGKSTRPKLRNAADAGKALLLGLAYNLYRLKPCPI